MSLIEDGIFQRITESRPEAHAPTPWGHISDPDHRVTAIGHMNRGDIVVSAFNGVYGIFGDADNVEAAAKVYTAKNRPHDKSLVMVCPPNYLEEHVDVTRLGQNGYSLDQLAELYQQAHALGIILPAGRHAPPHLVKDGTLLNIWTEYLPYQPFRHYVEGLRERGGRALLGTSANVSGERTHINARDVYQAFEGQVAQVLIDDFSHLPDHRKKSTSVINLTGSRPRLHREGNMPSDEIEDHLAQIGLPPLEINREEVIFVRGRAEH